MCDEVETGAAPNPVDARYEQLKQELAELRREMVELRMSQRKALLEELAGLERPLVEQGVIAQRTRPPRH